MPKTLVMAIVSVVLFCAHRAGAQDSYSLENVLTSSMEFQHAPAEPNSLNAVAVHFKLAQGWHFYADAQTAPSGMNLKARPSAKNIIFSEPVIPPDHDYFDKVTKKKLRVFSGTFTIYIPFTTGLPGDVNIAIAVRGLTCSEQLCRPINYNLSKSLTVSGSAPGRAAFEVPTVQVAAGGQKDSASVILLLAILAGLLLNVMPCVWPVLPIIIMKILSAANKKRSKSIALGFAFGLGILLFFAALAVLNIVLKLGFGLVFQWGDQFRSTGFISAMALLMVVLAMFMFGVFSFGVHASVSGGENKSGGFAGSVGTGFLAAVLSTPCSFAILTFVLVWAQTQPLLLSTITIMTIGIGMAMPYVILTSSPSLLAKIPKPGRWMEIFRQATGFLLLGIGVKLIEAVPSEKLINLLYYAVVLAVCVWIWGSWLSYNTPRLKKWLIRLFALTLAVIAGLYFFSPPPAKLIKWQSYDAQKIDAARQNGRAVLIKFNADWCMSCKVVEKMVFSNRDIAALIKEKNVLAINGDTTKFDYPASAALREIYKEPAVPVTVLLLPGSKEPVKLPGIFIKGRLRELLSNLPNRK